MENVNKAERIVEYFFCFFFKFFLNLSFCSFIFFGIEVRFFWAEKQKQTERGNKDICEKRQPANKEQSPQQNKIIK